MKRLGIFAAVVIILIIGGGLTTQLIARQDSGIIPALQIVDNPEGSVLEVVPWKAEQFILMVGFILFNLIGMGVTIAIVVWLLDMGIRRTKSKADIKATTAPARTERTTATE